jgi:hypothetical protein
MNIYTPNDKLHQPIHSKRTLHEIRYSYSTWEPIRLKWQNSILVCDDTTEEEPPRGTVTLGGSLGVETERGIQFYTGGRTEWLPKKLVQWNSADQTMTMPAWIAQKHGFVEK